MSRFYDALKQANRLHRGMNGNAAEVPVPAQAAAPALDLDALVGPFSPPEPPEHTAATPNPQRPAPLQQPEERSSSRNRLFGTAIKLVIDKKARVIPNIADHVVVEHYRRLRTKLLQQNEEQPFRTVLVTSANPQEGKTVTVLNLALSFSMLPSFRVAVVDGDLRRGSLGQWLGQDERPGLSDVIEGSASLEDVVFKSDDIPVHFIVRGASKLPAAELLHSPRLATQIEAIREQFDLVLIDSAPINLITDTHILAANCDAVMLVARAFATTSKSFEKAAEELSGRRIIGAVLNGGAGAQLYRKYNGYYY